MSCAIVTKVSFLHLGQQSGKLTITVSTRTLVRVLFPQTRQRAQKDSLQWAFMCAFGKAISLRSSSGCDGKWISAAFIPLQQRSDFCIAGQKRGSRNLMAAVSIPHRIKLSAFPVSASFAYYAGHLGRSVQHDCALHTKDIRFADHAEYTNTLLLPTHCRAAWLVMDMNLRPARLDLPFHRFDNPR